MRAFYLGIHRPSWLADPRFADVPTFVSRRTFLDSRTGGYRKTFPRALGRYAVDSGGFTELQQFGRWTITPAEYVAFLRRLRAETGPFDFAAPMDHMCEPVVINGGTFKGIKFVGTRQFIDPDRAMTFDQLVHVTGHQSWVGACTQKPCVAWFQDLRARNAAELKTNPAPTPAANVGGVLDRHLPEIDWYTIWRHLDERWTPPPEAQPWTRPKFTLIVDSEPEEAPVTTKPSLTVIEGGWR